MSTGRNGKEWIDPTLNDEKALKRRKHPPNDEEEEDHQEKLNFNRNLSSTQFRSILKDPRKCDFRVEN
jgi:hypothetical protein